MKIMSIQIKLGPFYHDSDKIFFDCKIPMQESVKFLADLNPNSQQQIKNRLH